MQGQATPQAFQPGLSKLLYTIAETRVLLSLSRTVVYEQLNAGRLRSVQQGRARLIPAAALVEYVALLEREAAAGLAGGRYGRRRGGPGRAFVVGWFWWGRPTAHERLVPARAPVAVHRLPRPVVGAVMAGRGSTLQGTAPGRVRVGEMQAALAEAGLSGLSYGQLAVALAASDMPDQRQDDVPAECVAKWAQQGVDRLSVQGVRELDECSIRVNLAFLDGHLTRAGHAALVRQMWGSNRRRQLSHDLACRAGHWPGGGR